MNKKSSTTSGRVKTSITLPPSLVKRLKRAAALDKRTFSGEIEYAVERHLERVEKERGLPASVED